MSYWEAPNNLPWTPGMLRAAADSAERWKPRLSSCQETYFQITKDKETGQLVAQG